MEKPSEVRLCECHGEAMRWMRRERRYRAGGYWACVEKLRENHRAYREKNREKLREKGRAYREKNREKLREYRRAYREENREKLREKGRAYYEDNREKKCEVQRAYWHRADGGYIRWRRRELAAQRERITEQLGQLAKEAAAC